MTDVKPNEKPSPHDIELLMPWHAAGTLNSRDAEDVDKALSQDEDLARRFAIVRKEMTETIHLNEMLGAPSPIIMVVQAAVPAHMLQADRDSAATFQTASATVSTTRGIEIGSYAMVR